MGWHLFHGRGHSGPFPNVVLVSIDTCRADHLSCYGYKRRTTPNIDALGREGTMFDMALAAVPLTTPSHSTMFTGTYPPTHGVHLNACDRLANSNVTLAKMLHDAGYQTAAFVAAFTLDSRFGLNQGFDTYDGRFSEGKENGGMTRRAGEEVSRSAMAWLDEHGKQPFFLFLHYFDAHFPCRPHPLYAAEYADDHYAGEIAYIDACIGQVLDRLRGLGIYDNTLVIVTGDHGESQNEHGEPSHGYFVYQATLRVPLVVCGPGCRKGIRVEAGASLADIAPTVVDLAGLKIPAQDGRDEPPQGTGGRAAGTQPRVLQRVAGGRDLWLLSLARDRGGTLEIHSGAPAGTLRPEKRPGRVDEPGSQCAGGRNAAARAAAGYA